MTTQQKKGPEAMTKEPVGQINGRISWWFKVNQALIPIIFLKILAFGIWQVATDHAQDLKIQKNSTTQAQHVLADNEFHQEEAFSLSEIRKEQMDLAKSLHKVESVEVRLVYIEKTVDEIKKNQEELHDVIDTLNGRKTLQ